MIALLNVTDFTGIGLQPWWINFDSIVGWHAGQMMGTALGASFVLCHCCFTVPLQSMGGMCQYQMFQGNVRTGDRPSDNITQIKLAVHMLTVTNSLKQSAREWVCKRPFTQHNTGLKRQMPACMCIAVNEKDLVWYIHFSKHAPTKSTMCGNSDGIRVGPNKEPKENMVIRWSKQTVNMSYHDMTAVTYRRTQKRLCENPNWRFLKKSTVSKNDIKESLKEII